MKKILLLISLFSFSFFTVAQTQTTVGMVMRNVTDKGVKGLFVSYSFAGISRHKIKIDKTTFERLTIKDFTFLKEVGKPALPVHYDLVIIPDGAEAKIISKSSDQTFNNNILIYPALRLATDRYGDPEPGFTIDSAFYESNTWYPEKPVKIVNIVKLKGISLAIVQICPVQYNPKHRQAKLFDNLNYEIKFTKSASIIVHNEQYSSSFLKNLQNLVLNNSSLNTETTAYSNLLKSSVQPKSSEAKNYIIITHSDYREAADSLSKWKCQLGYSVEVISRSSWTSAQIKSELYNRYQSWIPKPDYFVIIGDHDKVPGEIHTSPPDPFIASGNFATDLYYACMDGPSDYVADMAFGRISVSSASQAMSVVNKIIKYEKNPPAFQNFYTKGTGCAYFQDDEPNTYEDRRFVLTMEEVRDYMQYQGFTIDRVYKTGSAINPLYYNDGFYANSEPLPSDLLRPDFAWDGDKNDIAAALNSTDGRLFLAHRDHGYVGGSGWATPEFTSNDINLLNNGDKLPVVFSINCHTGEFQLPECFAEKFLRKTNGGAVGVFAAAYYSYSGFNDGLIDGMFDAIWPNPGLIPDFTGNADEPVGSPLVHQPIYTMGDVMNQGMLRMVQTWGDNQYSHELFHYFGDPAMKIWTAFPDTIFAIHDAFIECHDTTFTIDSNNCTHCLATLVVDGELVASDSLTSDSLTLYFSPVAGNSAVLTISEHNRRPYTANIPFSTPCIRPRFNIEYGNACVGQEINFVNTSTGNILTYNWNFGLDAAPQTAGSSGPYQVVYSSPGMKIISLTVSDATTTETYTDSVYIEQPCVFNTVQNQHILINSCQGTLFDIAGTEHYLPNSNDTVTISASGASSINLHFTDFDVEQGDAGYCNYDYLEIYDGADMSATLIGKYCSLPGNEPPVNFVASGNSVTLHFYSDGYTEGRGYEVDFNCSATGQIPSASFTAEPIETCDGLVNFHDLSTNSPVVFHWDFGDGDTSNFQNPVHVYSVNGNYTVKLTVSNAYGSNSFTRTNYITCQRPLAPDAINDTICGPAAAQLTAISEGTVRWYDNEFSGNLLYTGDTFTTEVLDTITTYYAESSINEIYTLGAPDTLIGSGGFYTGTTSHYTTFNCLADLLLVSVDVYAQTAGDRAIKLQAHSGTFIYDTVINLPVGKTTVLLNWNVPAASNYRLLASGPEFKLYRNTTGGDYPYSVSGLIDITGNSYGNQDYYYYFYNWKVQAAECLSARTPVTAFVYTAVPVASFTFSSPDNVVTFNNSSQNAVSYLWDFNDGNFSSEINPTHIYTANGSYHVSLTVFNACGNDVFTDTIDIVCVGIDESDRVQKFGVDPNPADESAVISWNSNSESIGFIELSDIFGQQLLYIEVAIKPGNNYETIDLSRFAQGVYFVKLKVGKQKFVVKLVIL